MNIKSIEILEKIISANGSCDDRTPSDCFLCPIGIAGKKAGTYPLGCVEYLGVESLSESEANAKYMEAAARSLADLKMDEILEEDDGAE